MCRGFTNNASLPALNPTMCKPFRWETNSPSMRVFNRGESRGDSRGDSPETGPVTIGVQLKRIK